MTAFLISTAVIFVAELGDKSQLMAMTFAARFKWWVVLLGITAATALTHIASVGIGYFIGASFEKYQGPIAIVAGIAKATLPPNPKVPWDGWLADYATIREAIDILVETETERLGAEVQVLLDEHLAVLGNPHDPERGVGGDRAQHGLDGLERQRRVLAVDQQPVVSRRRSDLRHVG